MLSSHATSCCDVGLDVKHAMSRIINNWPSVSFWCMLGWKTLVSLPISTAAYGQWAAWTEKCQIKAVYVTGLASLHERSHWYRFLMALREFAQKRRAAGLVYTSPHLYYEACLFNVNQSINQLRAQCRFFLIFVKEKKGFLHEPMKHHAPGGQGNT
jgi:hypothetical protein